MFPETNYVWKCKECGEEVFDHEDEEFVQLDAVLPTCPKCGGEMTGNPLVHGGPFSEHPFKKY